jgi:hypothetical protein
MFFFLFFFSISFKILTQKIQRRLKTRPIEFKQSLEIIFITYIITISPQNKYRKQNLITRIPLWCIKNEVKMANMTLLS